MIDYFQSITSNSNNYQTYINRRVRIYDIISKYDPKSGIGILSRSGIIIKTQQAIKEGKKVCLFGELKNSDMNVTNYLSENNISSSHIKKDYCLFVILQKQIEGLDLDLIDNTLEKRNDLLGL